MGQGYAPEIKKQLEHARDSGGQFYVLSDLYAWFDASYRTLPTRSELNEALAAVSGVRLNREEKILRFEFSDEASATEEESLITEEDDKLAYAAYRKAFKDAYRKLKKKKPKKKT